MSDKDIIYEDLEVLKKERSSVLKIIHLLEKELGVVNDLKFKDLLYRYRLLHVNYNKIFVNQRRIVRAKRIHKLTVSRHKLARVEIVLEKEKIEQIIGLIESEYPRFRGLLRLDIQEKQNI